MSKYSYLGLTWTHWKLTPHTLFLCLTLWGIWKRDASSFPRSIGRTSPSRLSHWMDNLHAQLYFTYTGTRLKSLSQRSQEERKARLPRNIHPGRGGLQPWGSEPACWVQLCHVRPLQTWFQASSSLPCPAAHNASQRNQKMNGLGGGHTPVHQRPPEVPRIYLRELAPLWRIDYNALVDMSRYITSISLIFNDTFFNAAMT